MRVSDLKGLGTKDVLEHQFVVVALAVAGDHIDTVILGNGTSVTRDYWLFVDKITVRHTGGTYSFIVPAWQGKRVFWGTIQAAINTAMV